MRVINLRQTTPRCCATCINLQHKEILECKLDGGFKGQYTGPDSWFYRCDLWKARSLLANNK